MTEPIPLQEFYDMCLDHYPPSGFIPMGRNHLIAHVEDSPEHEAMLVSFLEWLGNDRPKDEMPQRPVEDEEL